MKRVSDLWFRIRAFLGGKRMDAAFTDEMAFHLEMETKELIQGGMAPEEALPWMVLNRRKDGIEGLVEQVVEGVLL